MSPPTDHGKLDLMRGVKPAKLDSIESKGRQHLRYVLACVGNRGYLWVYSLDPKMFQKEVCLCVGIRGYSWVYVGKRGYKYGVGIFCGYKCLAWVNAGLASL